MDTGCLFGSLILFDQLIAPYWNMLIIAYLWWLLFDANERRHFLSLALRFFTLGFLKGLGFLYWRAFLTRDLQRLALVLLNATYFVKHMTVGTFLVAFVDLVIITRETDFVLAIAWIKVLLLFLQIFFANFTDENILFYNFGRCLGI